MNGEDVENLQKVEELKKMILKKVLTKKAIERLGRIRLVKPELALQLELYLVQLYQQGALKKEITDKELRLILSKLTEKRGFKIIK